MSKNNKAESQKHLWAVEFDAHVYAVIALSADDAIHVLQDEGVDIIPSGCDITRAPLGVIEISSTVKIDTW